MLVIRTRGRRMVGVDETMELWRPFSILYRKQVFDEIADGWVRIQVNWCWKRHCLSRNLLVAGGDAKEDWPAQLRPIFETEQ